MSDPTTAIVKSYSNVLCFEGEDATYLDAVTTINIALNTNGEIWIATVSCAHPHSHGLSGEPVKPGQTIPIVQIGKVRYCLQFSNEPGKEIFEAIRVTITGTEEQ